MGIGFIAPGLLPRICRICQRRMCHGEDQAQIMLDRIAPVKVG
jgi:hypothetical protein